MSKFEALTKICWPILFSAIIFIFFLHLTQYIQESTYSYFFQKNSGGNELELVVIGGMSNVGDTIRWDSITL